ncbi:MAG: hypothetical protein COB38_06690 [Gammaproteobacteria bacterium]|nr:MAG: hypothetical protein COB38_06690 [Gammaproteobacteria bacterium]
MLRTLSKLKFLLLLLVFISIQLNAKVGKTLTIENKKIGIYYYSKQMITNNAVTNTQQNVSSLSIKLKKQLSEIHPNLSVNVYNLSNKLPFEIDNYLRLNKDFAITIGEDVMLKILASRSDIPVFSLNTPRVTLDRMRKIYSDLGFQLSGIYREQPFSHQLALAEAIQPENKNIYLLLGMLSRYHLDQYKAEVARQNFSISFKILQNQDSPVAYFNSLSPQDGFLTLLDNPQQFTRQKIELLLPSSFHSNVPMIGNRKLHGEIAALASVYSSQNELVRESIKVISQYFTSGNYQKPNYLDKFSVFVNQQIAQNFNYKNLDEKKLEMLVNAKINQLNRNLSK